MAVPKQLCLLPWTVSFPEFYQQKWWVKQVIHNPCLLEMSTIIIVTIIIMIINIVIIIVVAYYCRNSYRVSFGYFPVFVVKLRKCQAGIPPCLWQQLQKWIVYNKGHEKVDVLYMTMIAVTLIQNSRVINGIPGHYLSRFWDDILLVSHGVLIS